jgi:uracil-DNA glycosylase family 4
MKSCNLSRKELDAVDSEIKACVKCPLSKSRRNAVPGTGNHSRMMLVGEAPGLSEDFEGKPFVGRAGKFLDTLLTKAGLSREQVFITNIVKCRPPRNREPRPIEIETCTPYLERQIRIIQPELIITLGHHSTCYFFSKAGLPFTTITKTHGKTYKALFLGVSTTIFPTFHPASELYSPKYKTALEQDFEVLSATQPHLKRLTDSAS